MEEKYPTPPMNFRQRLANFWYYNKWYTLIGISFFILILICLVQCSANVEPDAALLYVGPQSVSNKSCDEIRSLCAEAIREDYNGDGKKNVALKTITLSASYAELGVEQSGSDSQHDSFINYNNELLAGDSCILFLAPYFYEELAENGQLMFLEEALGYLPDAATDYYGIPLKNLPIYAQSGFSALPGNTMVCIKVLSSYGENDPEKQEKIQRQNIAVFRDLIEFSVNP